MAKLTEMPSKAIIRALKGKVDFYVWRGIPVARAWPQYRPYPPSPSLKRIRDAFAYINKLYPLFQAQAPFHPRFFARAIPLTGRDLTVRAYLKGVTEIMPPEYYATEETLLLVKGILDIIEDFAEPDNTLFGYSDHWADEHQHTMTEDADHTFDFGPVPADELWVLEAAHACSDARAVLVEFSAYTATGAIVKFYLPTTAGAWDFAVWSGSIKVPPGGYARVKLFGNLTGDTIYAAVWGYKMKIPEA